VVAARWREPTGAPALHPSRRQTVALLAALALVTGGVALASFAVQPERARAFDLFHGSVLLADQNSPVAVDLASGRATLRLLGADRQVGITGDETLGVVPLTDHTLLLNEASGEFNIVDNSGFVVKQNGGVPLAQRTGASASVGVAADDGQAYIVRTGVGGTDVYLVNEATVASAISAVTTVRPRASTSMPQPASTAPGGLASANGELWLLVGTGGAERVIRQLRVPSGSSSGAVLAASDHGVVSGPAALGTATDATGSSVTGVASAGMIRLFPPGAAPRTVHFRTPAGLDEVLPTSNDAGRLDFALHAAAGWSVVSVRADGSRLLGPAALLTVPADARLAEPAASGGRLFTIDQSDGQLYAFTEFGGGADAGRSTYPLAVLHGRAAEATDFGDAYVLARGPRVIYDSASHNNALMLFTDGTHPPVVVAKSSAVTVSAAGGAAALTRSNVAAAPAQPGKPTGPPRTRPQNVEPINTKIDCRTVTQKPHVPVITSALPGSRSVALAWSYPVLDVQDCYPSTYAVSVQLISSGAPQPPASVEVQSQTGATIGGLFPSTQYAITVTAYINGEGTASEPIRVTTGKEGPAAPTGLRVQADDSGSWTLGFDSCGAEADGCVPAQSWTITPSFCDGRGVSSPPPPVTVPADPTSRAQPPIRYPGGDELLGRGLQFQVQGTGDQGEAGVPSRTSPCVYSWTPPVLSAIHVQASAPPPTPGSTQPTTTTVTASFDDGAVHDLGGVGGTLTYQLLANGTVVSTAGPTSNPSATLHGVLPGVAYQVRVIATPPRHPQAALPLAPVPVAPAVADWPQLLLDPPTFDAPTGASGTLHVRFSFPPGTDTRGETFDLVDSQLSCGGGDTAMSLDANDVTPGTALTFPVDRTTYYGNCTVTVQLGQDAKTATNPPVYGAGSSRAVTSPPVELDPPTLTTTASDFSAQWAGPPGKPTVVVSYHGADDFADGARDWQLSIGNGSADCGAADDNPPPATIEIDKSCVKAGGTFTVDIGFTYFGVPAHFDVPVGGTAPSPVDPAKISFSAAWDATSPQVELTYSGTVAPPDLRPLDWSEIVTSSADPGVTCGSGTANPADGAIEVAVDLAACPPAGASYTVEISFTDPNYGQTGDYTYRVQGSPPP
jgi:hypothetical protein